MGRQYTYGDIVRVAMGMDEEQRAQFAGILEAIMETDRHGLALLDLGLGNGTIGAALGADAVEVMKWLAERERKQRFITDL